jgi:hypothetical protein
MKSTSVQVAGVTTGFVHGLGNLFGKAARTASEQVAQRRTPRRTSRAPMSVSVSARGVSRTSAAQRPKQQHPSGARSRGANAPARSSLKRRAIAVGAATTLCAVSVYAVFFANQPAVSVSSTPVQAAPAAVPPPPQVPTAAPTETGPPPGAFPEPAALDTEQQAQSQSQSLTANVPLFGPQQMATTEPAPLTPPPNAVDEVSMALDQTFAKPVIPALSKNTPAEGKEGETAKGEAKVAPTPESNDDDSKKVWQVGRMQLPIIHRLRLDGGGSAVVGSKTPTGFSVLIPGRKVMESGNAIQKRDDRILGVNVKNTPAGGKVTFRFRKDIPGYKVRLRNDYVEFFVNSEQ